MIYTNGRKTIFCDQAPSDCLFEIKSYATGTTVHHDDIEINYLIYCQSGHARISITMRYFVPEKSCSFPA